MTHFLTKRQKTRPDPKVKTRPDPKVALTSIFGDVMIFSIPSEEGKLTKEKTTLIKGGTVVLGQTVSQQDLLIQGEHVMNADDVVVGQFAGRADFELETLDGLGVGTEEIVENLDGHDFIHDQVAGFIDNAHRSPVDFLDDFKAALEFTPVGGDRRPCRSSAELPLILFLQASHDLFKAVGHVAKADVILINTFQGVFGVQ